MPSLVLYQPDIAPNVGTMLRMAACLNLGVHVIEPCGFPWDDRKFKRAGMDYLDQVLSQKHASWEAFYAWKNNAYTHARVVLLTTKASTPYVKVEFREDDFVMVGRESAGVPEEVHQSVDVRVNIPMHGNARSLNVAMAAAMVMGEVLRQVRK